MPERFLSITEVAARLGVDRSAVSHYKLPEPDAYVGKARGWRAATIDEWQANRPGRGARTDLRDGTA